MTTTTVDGLGDIWTKEVYRFLTPIVETDRYGRPCPIGTGVFVLCHEREYLLTAYHVTQKACIEEDSAVYAFTPEQSEIVGVNNYIGDPIDLSFTELPQPSRPCLHLPRHLASEIQEGEPCLVVGFPARTKSWQLDHTRHTLRPAPFSYLGTVSRRLPHHRFSVWFSHSDAYRDGRKHPQIGMLNGISGGGAFVLRNDRPRLAGIIIEYHSSKKELVCTDSTAIRSFVTQLGNVTNDSR